MEGSHVYENPIMQEETVEEFAVIDQYLLIRMPHEVDHYRSLQLKVSADRYIATEDVKNIVFDFERTRFMDSSGIGVIMGRYKKIDALGGQIFAIHASKQIQKIIKLSGLQAIMEILEG